MRVLAITNMLPTPPRPVSGVFVEQQVQGLQSIGIATKTVFFDRQKDGARVYYQMEPAIRQAVAEFDPDVVHVMYGGVMADRITRMTGLPPTVVTFHGSDLLGENLSGVTRRWISQYGIHCSRRAALRAQRLVVVGRRLLSCLPQVTHPKTRIIPCGIDLERFKPMPQRSSRKRLGWNSSTFHVLFVDGTNDPVKRPWLAHRAIAELQKLGVEAELHVMSGVPNTDVPVWMNACDVLLVTSLHEGSPTVVKEALACQKPVVSVDVGDVSEQIRSLPFCHIASSDPFDLALKLQQVYQADSIQSFPPQTPNNSHIHAARQLEALYREVTVTETQLSLRSRQHSSSISKMESSL